MPIQRIADVSGDSPHKFAIDNEAEVAEAMERFNDLVNKQKYTAYNPGKNGEGASQVKVFDKTIDETVFMPQRQGG